MTEACRSFKDTVTIFKDWLVANPDAAGPAPEEDEEDDDEDRPWNFEAFKGEHKLTDSSRRIKNAEEDETWVGVPVVSSSSSESVPSINASQEYRNVYTQGVNLIAAITRAAQEETERSASAQENLQFSLLRELIHEIRAFREVYMVAVSRLTPLKSKTDDSQHHIASNNEDGGVPESVRRHFTRTS